MSATYLAWNGQSYPWPPPEGWYEATDGRWWAPGSGLDPMPGDRSPNEVVRDDTSPGLESRVAATTTPAPTTAEPTDRQTNPLGTETLSAPVDDQSTILTSHPTQVVGPPPGLDRIGSPVGPTSHGAPPPGIGVWQPPSDQPAAGSRMPIIVGVAVLAACIVGGVAVFAVGRGNEPADPELSELSGTTGTDTVGVDSEAQPDDPAAESPADATPAVDATSSTTTAESTTTEAPSIDLLTDEEKAEEFRLILDSNGLSGDLLSDDDLIEFGTSFCIFAIGAQNFDEYTRFRQEAISQSDSELTDDELVVAVDGAVSTFCPDDAVRLGLRPAGPVGPTG